MAAAWMRLVPPAGPVARRAPPYGQNADSTFFLCPTQIYSYKSQSKSIKVSKKKIIISAQKIVEEIK